MKTTKKEKIGIVLAIMNTAFWIGLSGILTIAFQSVAFLFVSGGMWFSIIILDLFEEEYLP